MVSHQVKTIGYILMVKSSRWWSRTRRLLLKFKMYHLFITLVIFILKLIFIYSMIILVFSIVWSIKRRQIAINDYHQALKGQ